VLHFALEAFTLLKHLCLSLSTFQVLEEVLQVFELSYCKHMYRRCTIQSKVCTCEWYLKYKIKQTPRLYTLEVLYYQAKINIMKFSKNFFIHTCTVCVQLSGNLCPSVCIIWIILKQTPGLYILWKCFSQIHFNGQTLSIFITMDSLDFRFVVNSHMYRSLKCFSQILCKGQSLWIFITIDSMKFSLICS